ncbi:MULTISPECIES: helix-turn-helix domain-containing protein [Yersiniaceae]|nr:MULTISPECIES: helix-turn-helix domain-containing protein [Yersiniaceae]MDV5140202.1 helix-turn-helix domain-containing protein [Chimaeribacter arupi]WKZ94889.1 helix-turn-helix domain-containing protein [Chimaeribacter arupi]
MSRLKQLHEMAQAFNKSGTVSDETVEFIGSRLKAQQLREKMPKPEEMDGTAIRALRDQLHISQSMLAYTLNMSVESVSKWERGEKKPNGAALRMLDILRRKGLSVFAQ